MNMEASTIVDKLLRARPVQLSGHKKPVNYVAWNLNGTILASGSLDKTLKLWSVSERGAYKEICTLSGHQENVTQVCWNQEAKRSNLLVSCSTEKDIRIWDATTKKCIKTIPTKGDNINVTWSPTGDYIVVGNRQDVLTLIDARRYKIVMIKKFNHEINELAFDITGSFLFLASGADGVGKVEIFRVLANRLIYKCDLVGHTQSCFCVQTAKTFNYLLSGGGDSLVNLWDLNELVCVRSFGGCDHPTRAVSISHDSKIVAIAGEDASIVLSNVDTGKVLGSIDINGIISALAWNPEQHSLAISGEEDKGSPFLRVIGINQ